MNQFENQPAGGGTLRYGETIRGQEPSKLKEHDTIRVDSRKTIRGVGDEDVVKESENWGLEEVEESPEMDEIIDNMVPWLDYPMPYHLPKEGERVETLKGLSGSKPVEEAFAGVASESAPSKKEELAGNRAKLEASIKALAEQYAKDPHAAVNQLAALGEKFAVSFERNTEWLKSLGVKLGAEKAFERFCLKAGAPPKMVADAWGFAMVNREMEKMRTEGTNG